MIKSLSHLTLLLLAILLSGSCKRGGSDGGGASIDTIPMMVQQIKECSRLYTAEYKVHKIITHSDTCLLYTSPSPRDS